MPFSPPTPSAFSRRLILLAFTSTLLTAALISGTALVATAADASRRLARLLPEFTDRVADAIEGAREAPEPAGAVLARALSDATPDALRVSVTDAAGQLVATHGDGSRATPRWSELGPGLHRYAAPDGTVLVASIRRIEPGGWVVAELPLEVAYAPVLALAPRLLAADLLVVLAMSALAYRSTRGLVRPIESVSEAARHIAAGSFDHPIPGTEASDEIGLLARTLEDMMRHLRGYQSQLERANSDLQERNLELKRAKETFEQLSITDGLTRLHNHRYFQDFLNREIKRVSRSGEPLSMLIADIDDFKALNDRLGHAAGDELLARIAEVMSETVRDSDLLARYGGEEFVVVTPATDATGAYHLAEKVRTAVAETPFVLDGPVKVNTTLSIGVASFDGDRKAFFVKADRALYRAKAAGKNCVVVAEDRTSLS